MSKLQSITGKILISFCTVVALIMLVTGATLTWRLNSSIERQSAMLDKDVISNTFSTLKGHHEILKSFNSNIRENALRHARDLAGNPVLKTIVENEMHSALSDFFASQISATEVDFAVLFDANGAKLIASYPDIIDKNQAQRYFTSTPLLKQTAQDNQDADGSDTEKYSSIQKVDKEFLGNLGFAQLDVANQGGIVMSGAAVVKDSFGGSTAIIITGTFLNGHDRFLKQLYEATGSAASLYIGNFPIAQAGYRENMEKYTAGSINLNPEFLKEIYAADNSVNKVIQLGETGFLATCSAITTSGNDKIGAQCVGYPEAKIIKAAAYGIETKNDLRKWFLIIGMISLAVFILVSIVIAKSIARPLMLSITDLNQCGARVDKEANEISSTSQLLSNGAKEQAASLQETTASLEEMASMTRRNADNSTHANEIMKEVSSVISTANISMQELTSAMQDISSASEETSKIIKTIDDIAFQTNLLALNAAVEAARAGEAGAGFAVVADEVRNLAMRAAEAARETGELIEGTVTKVKDGSGIVEKTAGAFSEVTQKTEQASSLVDEITVASQEQARGIEQLNNGMAVIDKVTQENAEHADLAAEASIKLTRQAEKMAEVSRNLTILVIGGDDDTGGKDVELIDDQEDMDEFEDDPSESEQYLLNR